MSESTQKLFSTIYDENGATSAVNIARNSVFYKKI